ncbi:unnamed protein product [Ixodes hexagonus]
MRCRGATPAEPTTQPRESRAAFCFEKDIARDGEAWPTLQSEFRTSRLVHGNFQNLSNARAGTGTGPTTLQTSTSSATRLGRCRCRGMVLGSVSNFASFDDDMMMMMIIHSQFSFPLHLRRGQYRGTAVRSDRTSISIFVCQSSSPRSYGTILR